MRVVPWRVLGLVLIVSCGSPSQQAGEAKPKKEWTSAHNPFRFDAGSLQKHNYLQKFSELPREGSLSKRPWTDDYWPSVRGGISYRWNDSARWSKEKLYAYSLIPYDKLSSVDLKKLSPAEKFDIFLGRRNYPYTQMERARTQVLKTVSSSPYYDRNFDLPEWEGLCHGLAPAALFFDEPQPVVVKGPSGIEVPFGSSDVKALLIYFLTESDAPTSFLGTRCDVDIKKVRHDYRRGRISRRSYEEQLEECSGVNAGAFHIVMANQIARLNEGFVIDLDPGPQVWNQPVYGFSTRIVREKSGASVGAAPGTVKELEMNTRIDYMDEIDSSWEPDSDEGVSHKTYLYRLELDAHDNIIGGAWSDDDHPDFAWKQEQPEFKADFSYIKKIYEASLRQNS